MYMEISNSTFAQETSSEEMTWKTGIEVRITFAFYRELMCRCLNKLTLHWIWPSTGLL